MNLFQKFSEFLFKSRDDEILRLTEKVNDLEQRNSLLQINNTSLTSQVQKLTTDNLNLEVKVFGLTPIPSENETFYEKNFKKIENIRYKSKRTIKSNPIDMELNQLFTPNQFEVQKHRKKINYKTPDLYNTAYRVGDYIAKLFTWTDDKNLDKSGDYYLYAEEALVLKLCDCEDHTFTVCSLEPEIDAAYGFYIDDNKKEVGHAFNCFVYKNELYIMDTVGDKVEIFKYNNQTQYRIHFIITKGKTYQVNSGVRFGEIAGW